MKICVLGSRDIPENQQSVDLVTKGIFLLDIGNPSAIVNGTARGGDKIGAMWAKQNGVPTLDFKPDWDRLEKAAGFVRNKDMCDIADAAIILWDGSSRGTRHMMGLCQRKGIPTVIFDHASMQWARLEPVQ